MEASKRVVYALLIMGIAFNILGSVEAKCIVQNSSSNDMEIKLDMPTEVFGNFRLGVNGRAQIPSNNNVSVILKNLGNGNSTALKLVDGTMLVCVNGGIKGTISVYPGEIHNGVLSILASTSPMITSL